MVRRQMYRPSPVPRRLVVTNGSKMSAPYLAEQREKLAADFPNEVFKPCGIPIELADFVIRVCQYYGSAGRGDELERGMGVEHALRPHNDVPDDAEALITGLHASTSMAFIAFSFALAGNKVDLPAIGFPSEPLPYLASALLSLFDFCKKKDINLWAAIDEKEAYNRTRPQKHGGKKM
mgnify:CR=1 FL=1